MKSQVPFQLEVDLQPCKTICFPEVFPMYFLQNNVSLTRMQQPEDISPLEVLLSFADQLIEGKDILAVNNQRLFLFLRKKMFESIYTKQHCWFVSLFIYLFYFILFSTLDLAQHEDLFFFFWYCKSLGCFPHHIWTTCTEKLQKNKLHELQDTLYKVEMLQRALDKCSYCVRYSGF